MFSGPLYLRRSGKTAPVAKFKTILKKENLLYQIHCSKLNDRRTVQEEVVRDVTSIMETTTSKLSRGKERLAGLMDIFGCKQHVVRNTVLFYFASLIRIENISIISKGDKQYKKQWREPPAIIEFIYKNLRHAECNEEKQPRVNWSTSSDVISTRSGM